MSAAVICPHLDARCGGAPNTSKDLNAAFLYSQDETKENAEMFSECKPMLHKANNSG
jgi:hypothetical protein